MLDADYLPRVQYGRCILSRCRWRIKTSLFKKTTAADFPPTFTTFRKKRNIPNTCFLIDFDSELYLDFTREDDLDILRRYIDKREYVVIEENLYDADNSIVVGPDGVYANEVILSFVVA